MYRIKIRHYWVCNGCQTHTLQYSAEPQLRSESFASGWYEVPSTGAEGRTPAKHYCPHCKKLIEKETTI